MYPIRKQLFETKYTPVDEKFTGEFEYMPSVMSLSDEKTCELMSHARKCISRDDAMIYAVKLEKSVKVFSQWDYEKYMYGLVGDYLCYPTTDKKDIYVVKNEVFQNTYKKID